MFFKVFEISSTFHFLDVFFYRKCLGSTFTNYKIVNIPIISDFSKTAIIKSLTMLFQTTFKGFLSKSNIEFIQTTRIQYVTYIIHYKKKPRYLRGFVVPPGLEPGTTCPDSYRESQGLIEVDYISFQPG